MDPEKNHQAKERFPGHGNERRSPEHRGDEVKSCQILYFLPILSNVKIAFKIFKVKLLEWYLPGNISHHCVPSSQVPGMSQVAEIVRPGRHTP